MNSLNKTLLASIIIVICSGCQTSTQASNTSIEAATEAEFSAASDSARALYRRGQKALDDGNWSAAESAFRELAAMKSSHADAALYWQAYSQYRDGKSSRAVRTLSQLYSEHSNSRWSEEGRTLQAEITGNTELSDNDEMKLMALQSLMHSSSERAIPLLKKTLASDASPKIKETALFILSQKRATEARELLIEYARNANDPLLQAKSVEILGMAGDEASRAVLADLYDEVKSLAIKENILTGMMMSRDEKRLIDIAKSEKQPELQAKAIEMLGVLGSDKLLQLYNVNAAASIKESIINGLMIARDDEALIHIIKQEKDHDVMIKAIQMIGINGSHKGSDYLQQVWKDNSTTSAVKKAILEAWMIGKNYPALTTAANDASSKELRMKAIRMLGVTGQRQPLRDLYDSVTDPEIRRQVVESLLMTRDESILDKILENETDPDLLNHAIHLSMSFGDQKSREKLNNLYQKTDNTDVKHAILESHLVNGDINHLIRLLDSEKEQQLRSKIIEILAISNNKKAADRLQIEYQKTDDIALKKKILEAYMISNDAERLVEVFRTESDSELKRTALRLLSSMQSEAAQDLMLELLEKD